MSRTAHLGQFRLRRQPELPEMSHGIAQKSSRSGESEPGDHVGFVRFDGLDTDAEALGDDPIGESVRDALEHLTLALGETAGALCGAPPDGANTTLPANEGLT